MDTDMDISIIDQALAKAKARRAEFLNGPLEEVTPKKSKVDTDEIRKESSLSSEDRAAARAKRTEERATRAKLKLEREAADKAAKAERKAQREAKKALKASKENVKENRLAHMKKVENAKAKLPALQSETQLAFNELIANHSAEQLASLALYLQLHNREAATVRANQLQPLTLGATVRITGGEHKYIGMTGKVVHSQKLRAKVEVPGVKKVIYIFNGEADVIEEPAALTG